ncbi:hypothetical protein INR49_008797, partial [Caranx melampygus]
EVEDLLCKNVSAALIVTPRRLQEAAGGGGGGGGGGEGDEGGETVETDCSRSGVCRSGFHLDLEHDTVGVRRSGSSQTVGSVTLDGGPGSGSGFPLISCQRCQSHLESLTWFLEEAALRDLLDQDQDQDQDSHVPGLIRHGSCCNTAGISPGAPPPLLTTGICLDVRSLKWSLGQVGSRLRTPPLEHVSERTLVEELPPQTIRLEAWLQTATALTKPESAWTALLLIGPGSVPGNASDEVIEAPPTRYWSRPSKVRELNLRPGLTMDLVLVSGGS